MKMADCASEVKNTHKRQGGRVERGEVPNFNDADGRFETFYTTDDVRRGFTVLKTAFYSPDGPRKPYSASENFKMHKNILPIRRLKF